MKCFLNTFLLVIPFLSGFSQDTWNRIADMLPPIRCQSVAFSLGSKGYVAGGQEFCAPPWHVQKDFQQYDPKTDTWVRLSDLPQPLTEGVAFTIGSNVYITTGRDSLEEVKVDCLYSWDTLSATWENIGFIPSALKRLRAVGFSIGNKGYIATGIDSNQTGLLNDLWEYDPVANTWTQKEDFPGIARYDASCFVVNDKAYITNGHLMWSTSNTNDLWEYDPAKNSWTQKDSFPGSDRAGAIGFSIGSKGYILGGTDNYLTVWDQKLWEYNPDTDQWKELTVFPGTYRVFASSFTINNRAYITPGWFYYFYPDTWEFIPPPVSVEEKKFAAIIYPNPAINQMFIDLYEKVEGIFLYDIFGVLQYYTPITESQRKVLIDVSPLKSGLYILKLMQRHQVIGIRKVLVGS